MVEIKRKIKWFAGLIAIIPFCIIVTFAFWSTSGGWTETYLKDKINDKILKDDKFIISGIDNVISAKTNDYPIVVQAPPFEYFNNYDIDAKDDRYNRLWDNIIPWTNLTPYNLPLKAQLLEYDIVQIVSLRIL